MVAQEIDENWSVLKIPSFKAEFFGYAELARVKPKLEGKNIVIDVRDNAGGNFVAITRLLSMLQCEGMDRVGMIFHNRTELEGEAFMEDDLSDQKQIRQVTSNNPVYLNLFKTELCLNAKNLTLLINENTASVSELFVQILKNQRKDLKVYGTRSAGQMVLSIWYPLKNLGAGVMLSVPYAWATALDQRILEGQGVGPTEEIDTKKSVSVH